MTKRPDPRLLPITGSRFSPRRNHRRNSLQVDLDALARMGTVRQAAMQYSPTRRQTPVETEQIDVRHARPPQEQTALRAW
jgi:hypothetical protein